MKLSEASKILEVVLTQELDLGEEDLKRVAKAKKVWITYYKKNPKKFIEAYIRILHGLTNEECDFILNEAQNSLVSALKDNRFVAAPKARQLGITTLTNALALHHSLFTNNANVICMAYITPNAQENLKRIKTMFKTMPKWVQKLVMVHNEAEGHQNNLGLWSFHSKITNTDNKLEVATANSEDATRGKTPTFLHWTETHFSEVASQIFTSVFPALNRRKDSVIILESTGNGNSGFYYEVCTGRRKGFKVIFMPWFLDPNYRLEGDELSGEDLEYMKDLMGVEEIPEELDHDQLRWFRATSETVGKAKCQQEYPINVEQVFQATNSSFFSYKAMQKAKGGEVLRTIALDHGFITPRPAAPGQLYEEVKTEYEYLIGVDSSEGQNDPSVITILNPKGEEVLFWRELIVPDELVKLLDVLGKQYNNAKIVVESNGIGMYVIQSLITQYVYPNMFFAEDGKPGIRTTGANKASMLAQLQDFILNDKLVFKNTHLREEMATFEADSLRAQKGTHDDCVMASAIAAHGFKVNRPKLRTIQEDFYDYTRDVYGNNRRRRPSFISRRQ